MIDIRLIRENPELVKENIKKKFQDEKLHFIEDVKKKDEEWRKLKFEADNLRKERNKVSEQINQSKKSKDNKKAEELIKKAKDIPIEIEKIEEKAVILEKEIRELMYQIPNIIHKSVPIGKDSSENVDFDTARETSGKGFFYLKGQLAILSSAMLNLAKDYMIKQGYEYIEPPLMIRKKVVEGVMSQKEIEDMMYKIEGEDLYLIATSEYPLVGMYMEKILQKSQIPQKITGFSPCFRKEIGAHGIEEKGFYRLHQFYKQEMVVICEPEDSYKFYDEMLKHTLSVMKALEIPVRVLECCSGDLADLKAKSCDVEAWSPRQKKYFEAGSLTNMEEAQARRLNIKINGAKGNYFAHTLNNTVLANPRTMIALMENHQQKDGSIKVPKALWKYTGFKKIQRK